MIMMMITLLTMIMMILLLQMMIFAVTSDRTTLRVIRKEVLGLYIVSWSSFHFTLFMTSATPM